MFTFQAISCHYAASECDYIECDGVQELISKEVLAIFEKRTGVADAQFQVRHGPFDDSLFAHVSYRMSGD
jgi:hypothetical protein